MRKYASFAIVVIILLVAVVSVINISSNVSSQSIKSIENANRDMEFVQPDVTNVILTATISQNSVQAPASISKSLDIASNMDNKAVKMNSQKSFKRLQEQGQRIENQQRQIKKMINDINSLGVE
jgi:hypothetical protein